MLDGNKNVLFDKKAYFFVVPQDFRLILTLLFWPDSHTAVLANGNHALIWTTGKSHSMVFELREKDGDKAQLQFDKA